jgi:hypothetical protein
MDAGSEHDPLRIGAADNFKFGLTIHLFHNPALWNWKK